MDSLEARIRAAFAGNRYPGDDHLTVYGSVGQTNETFRLLKGKTWEELPVVQFMSGDTPIPDLTLEAFHYYTPALLIGGLNEFPDLSNAFAFYFAPSSSQLFTDPSDQSEFRKRIETQVSLFSAEQREVIADVLREFIRREWDDEARLFEAIDYLEHAE